MDATYVGCLFTSAIYCRAPSEAPPNKVNVPRAFTQLGSQSLKYIASRAWSFRLLVHLYKILVLSIMPCRERRVLCVSCRCRVSFRAPFL